VAVDDPGVTAPQPQAEPHIEPPAEPPAEPQAEHAAIAALIARGETETALAWLAPLLEAHPADPALRRLQARATVDPALAVQRWHALRQALPDDPQAHVDLAEAVRERLGDPALAETVLQSALERLPHSLPVLEALVRSAARSGDDASLAAACRRLLAAHPEHAATWDSLIAALHRLDRADEIAALLAEAAEAAPDSLALLLRLAAHSPPQRALAHYLRARVRHPDQPAPALGLARTLSALDRADEAEDVLTEARRQLPDDADIAAAWAQQALDRGEADAAIDRAALLRSLAPDRPEADRIAAEAHLLAGRPAAALALLGPARAALPGDFRLAELEVAALNRLERWQAAAQAGAALVRDHPFEPAACIELATALVRLGRAAEAEAALRAARERCPGHDWMAVQLARLAFERGAADEALAWWHAAGLPERGPDSHRRQHALAHAQAGDPAQALALIRARTDGPESRWLRLAEAELLAEAGDLPQAAALWPGLAAAFALTEPGFAALTWRLATALPQAAADAPLQALLNEPDRPEPGWRPALARRLAACDPQDPVHDRLRAALAAAAGPDTLARAIASALAGTERDSDALAARVIRAVLDGRLELLALLLEQDSDPARTQRLRIALRLAVNRLIPTEAGFAARTAEQVSALLLAARVLDADSLAYAVALARPRFAPAAPPDLADAAAVVGCIAHRPLPQERRPPPAAPSRLRVALCLHGHLPRHAPALAPAASLALHGHDVQVFAHLWSTTQGDRLAPAALLAALPARLRTTLERLMAADGAAAVADRYPLLFAAVDADSTLSLEAARQRTGAADIAVEDPALPHLRDRSPAWRRRYQAARVQEMAARHGAAFDLVLHVDAAAVPALPAETDWPALARAAQGGTVFAAGGLQFRRGSVVWLDDTLLAGTMADLQLAAESFAAGERVARGEARIAGLGGPDIHRHSLAFWLHLHGVAVAALPGLSAAGAMRPAPAPLAPGVALGRVWACLAQRGAASADGAVVRAAVADVLRRGVF
jgi:predicted Zn-dependent protease